MVKLLGVVAIGVSIVLWTHAAEAQDDSAPVTQVLEELREMLLYARYRDAIRGAQGVLERGDLSAADRNAVLEVLATGYLVVNDRRGARETLQLLYARDPEHRLLSRDPGPAVSAAFERAREAPPAPVEITLESLAPAHIEQRTAPVFSVRVAVGEDAIHELHLSYRQADMPAFQSMEMLAGAEGTARARVPLLDGEDPYTIEWYVEAVAPSHAVIGGLGSAEAPLTLGVPRALAPEERVQVLRMEPEREGREESSGLLGQWWFWTLVAVVVLGGAGVALYLAQPQTEPGSLGEGTL